MSELSYRIVSGIGLVVSFVSMCSSIYILTAWHRLKKLKQNDLLNNYVAYMSVFDLLQALYTGTYLSNPTFKLTFISDAPTKVCQILGGFLQFINICMTTWNFVIAAFILLPIIIGQSMFRIRKQKYLHFIFISVMAFVCVLVPAINDGYGLRDNAATVYGLSKYECWIVNERDVFCLYGPVTFYILFSIVLLVWSIYKFGNNNALSPLLSKLMWYTAVFILFWLPEIVNRIYTSFSDSTSIPLMYLQMLTWNSYGWANAMVWYHYMKPVDVEPNEIDSHTLLGNDSVQMNQ
eukprot:421832_1